MTYPILYEANETDFFSLGLGPIKTATEAFVTEERNGSFILEGKVIIDDEIYPLLQENRIIKADASPTLTDQRFRIKRIVPSHDGQAEIYAEHVSYLSQELPMEPEVVVNGNATSALTTWKSAILDDNPFVVDSDIETNNKTNWRIDKVENPRQALGGVEGSILDVWGGEYRFDNYHISLLKKRGTTANTILAYGRNITDFEQERNIMDLYTSVFPYAIYTDDKENEQLVTIDDYLVDCENIADYPNRKYIPVDFSNEFEHDEVPTKAKLKQLAQDYIKNNDIGIPKTSIKLSFLDLAQTADYADVAALETVELCDDVRVHYEKLGVDTTAKVIRTKWNVLRGAYHEIEIGEKRTTLSSIINDTQTSIKDIENQTGSAIIAANGKNMIFHGLFGENGEGEPTATRVGDMWYKPNGEDTEFYIWDGTVWAFIMSTAKFDEIDNKVDELQTATEQAVENANNAVEQANQAAAKVDSLDKAVNTALEQSASAIDQAQQAIKDANNLLTTVTEVQGTVTNISTVVDEINNQLAVKVSQTDFDKLKGTVDTQAVQISANAKEISLKASQSSVNTITGNIESIQSELSVQAGSITAINSRVDGQQTQIGTLQSSYSGLSSTIANVKNDFDNLQLGGRNLLLQSSVADRTVISSNNATEYPITKTAMSEGSRNFVRVKRANPNSNPTALSLYSTISWNMLSEDIRGSGQVVVSFKARSKVPSKWSCMAATYNPTANNPSRRDLDIGTEWKTYSIVFDSIPAASSGLRFNPQQVVMDSSINLTDFYIDICEYKVERGNKATDWTPAPEDMATITEMSNITQTVKDIQATVADKVSQAQFTILSNQVTTTVKDVSNIQSQITQLSDSINLRVEKNDVVNQINISTEGILIAGKKIQITGETYIANAVIKSANIADLAVTGAKIADATIASAKIISLDVSKLAAGTMDTSKITIYGGSSTNYVRITTNQVEQKGVFNRTWQGTTTKHDTSMYLQNGYFRARNNTLDRSLYFSDFGISTFADGDGGGSSSGTIAFFDRTFNSDVNGLTLTSNNGVVALKADGGSGRVWLESEAMLRLDATTGGIALRPNRDARTGNNTFFYTIASTSNASEQHGYIVYGSESSGYAAGLRFSKGASDPRVSVVDGSYATGGVTTLETGIAEVNSVNARSGLQYVGLNRSVSGMMDFFVGKTSDGTKRMGSDGLYSSSGSGKALHITSGGSIVAYSSSERFKEQIQDASDVNAKALLNLELKSWIYKSSYSLQSVGEPIRRVYGLIAEDVERAGLNQYVERDIAGLVEGYKPELWTVTIPILREHEESIESLKKRVALLESQVRVLQAA